MIHNKNNFKIDFVGIGAMKAATSWIYECLQEHPEICLAPKDQKSIGFFFKNNPPDREIEAYRYFFKKDRLRGDFHVGYLTNPIVINRMIEHNPNIKIIVCLRNPVDRAISHFGYMRFVKGNKLSFKEAIEDNKNLLRQGLYYENLKRYFSIFPRKNILVLIYDNIQKDPFAFIKKIYAFLGVDERFVAPSVTNRINSTNFKLTKLGRFLHNQLISRLIKTKWGYSLKKNSMFKRLYCFSVNIYMSGRNVNVIGDDEHIRYRLRDYYTKDIEKTEKLIKKDLSFWK